MTGKTRRFWAAGMGSAAIVVVLTACSSEEDSDSSGTGGSYLASGGGTGGSEPATGGSPATGGVAPVTGGSSGVGGTAPLTGGTAGSSGGTALTGGSSGAGGASGSSAVGGSTASGGSEATIWQPAPGTTWQWQLSGGQVDTTPDVEVFDIDYERSASTVDTLHAQGARVICYISVGSWEDWRPDADEFPEEVLGNEYPGWPGERFVDIRAPALRAIMAARLDTCQTSGFDGVEPDNMDVFEGSESRIGFPLTDEDGIDYALWLADEAHARGLSIGQKNASSITEDVEPSYDWALTESCFNQGWCDEMSAYLDSGKAVFVAEYTDAGVDFAAACSSLVPLGYSPILKNRDLDAWVEFCP